MPAPAGEALIKYTDSLWEEGKAARDESGLKRAESHLAFQRGDQWPKNLPRGTVDFVLNVTDDIIQRKAGLMTDGRPQLQVISSNETVNARHDILDALEKVLRGIWDQVTWSEELSRGIGFTEVVGSIVGMMGWDPLADNGRGDIRPRFFDPRAFVLDPAVTVATELQEAEFCATEEVRTKASLLEQYGEKAAAVKTDGLLSSYPSGAVREQSGVRSPTLAGRPFRRRPLDRTTSVIPRAMTRSYWFKDFKRDERGQPIFVEQGRPARRVIRHAVIAGGVVLVDEPNPHWHKQYPYELLDWGLELDNPWGASEVQKLKRAQETLNKITSQMIRNTILTNNIKIVGESNALDAEQWDRLTNRPALIIRHRPGTRVEFESPPALPAYLFEMVQLLMRAMDLISGMGEVTRGTANASQSGVAIDSLAIASQTLIRFQARRLEAFISRLWSKAIPLVFQHYGLKRMIRLVGSGGRIETYLWDRSALFAGLVHPDELFQDFALHVETGSSLAVARIQKATLAMNLHQAGILAGVDVLRACDWPDPDKTYERGQAEMAAKMAGLPAPGGGGGRSMSAGRKPPAAFPASGPVAANGV